MKLSHVFEEFVLRHAATLAPQNRRGRPRSLDDSQALHHIFKVLRTGMQWRELNAPVDFTTVFRRMKTWTTLGVFDAAYADALRVYKKHSPPKYYCVDSSYVKNRFGRECVGRNHTDRGRKALKLSAIVDDAGIPHGICCHPGNRPDVVLLEDSIKSALVKLDALELFADRGYDSRRNRTLCSDYGLKDRIFRRKTKTVRRTNARRIVVEHTFARLDQYRRLLHFFEQRSAPYRAFALLGLGNLLCRNQNFATTLNSSASATASNTQ